MKDTIWRLKFCFHYINYGGELKSIGFWAYECWHENHGDSTLRILTPKQAAIEVINWAKK